MEILPVFKHALLISFFVFVMMLIVDFVDTASKRRISDLMRGGLWRQYFLSAFLGSTPGCLGAFMNVSLYVHGMISFGAIVGGMIATSGDEAFVMLSQFPLTAMALFILLFFSGIIFALILFFLIMVATGILGPSDWKLEAHHLYCPLLFVFDGLVCGFGTLSSRPYLAPHYKKTPFPCFPVEFWRAFNPGLGAVFLEYGGFHSAQPGVGDGDRRASWAHP